MSRVRSTRPLALATLLVAAALGLTTQAVAYNNSSVPCGKWWNGNPVSVDWKWGPDIITGMRWQYAFATVAEPNWDDSFAKIQLSYNGSANGEYDTYYSSSDGRAGQATEWCTLGFISDFLAEGNTYAYADTLPEYYTPYMGNIAGHEIGHTLGLGHSDYDAVMKSGYSGSWPTTDDSAGIAALYP